MSKAARAQGLPSRVDLLVIGGGINGCGIAADAAGRGLSVLLCEQGDLGAATSSASSKLIHGGLRYLEHHEYALVRQALQEREVLLRAAPHITWPLRLRLPHHPGLRPRWMLGAGLWLYDHLSRQNSLPRSRRWHAGAEDHLRAEFSSGFAFSDGWVDDSRLVISNALQAQGAGAFVLPRTRCVALDAVAGEWQVRLRSADAAAGSDAAVAAGDNVVQARAVVNAAGPWAQQLHALTGLPGTHQLRLVKGSHIVVPRLHRHNDAYMLQHADRRVVFVLPFEQDFTLIGTTEQRHDGDPGQVDVSADELDYLLGIVNAHFDFALTADDVVHRFAGVRPLLESDGDDSSSLSRDYRLSLDQVAAPILTVWGGKITTYRRLAELVLEQLRPVFPDMHGAWTAAARLPGGDMADHQQLIMHWQQSHPWLPPQLAQRWARSYGSLAEHILLDCSAVASLGEHLGHGLYQREVAYLTSREWASDVDDVLWRRSKLGLYFDAQQRQRLAEVMALLAEDSAQH